ncbi:alpha-E domain-containing protein [Oricola cellulosilytica]|uniref:Alpha-E domain-containing protein n=1 Tax=Oricola cellulosilytica TaxID=1429082 RepID=A0A4R0PHQ9_9HYPH|nr:alpha-E domain-containing protein [Oricola cellulosilytica]TCD16558.1 alpha-E domain-containing protein [Oricola cellulosilytica]
MLGKTAGGLYWMFRYFERSENTARLVDAGFRMSLTRSASDQDEWMSVIQTTSIREAFEERHDEVNTATVTDFLLRDMTNPTSVMSIVEAARNNARLVRTALTREVWEAVNECWITLKDALARPVRDRELPATLALIRQQSALVRAALHGTMLRNEIYDFARIGTFLERADNTARILDVKYYVLLPSVMHVGSSLDNVQWETILRSVSAQRAYRWLNADDISARSIAEFLILDRRLPRSLAFCATKIVDNLQFLADDYGERHACHDAAEALVSRLRDNTVDAIFDIGLHEFIEQFIRDNNALGQQIEQDYRFNG